MLLLSLISAFFLLLPVVASWRWMRRIDRSMFPAARVAILFIIPTFLVLYGKFGPFYDDSFDLNKLEHGQKVFLEMVKKQAPIKYILLAGCILHVGVFLYFSKSSKECDGFLLFSFGLLSIYASFFCVLYAADSLLVGGLT